MNTTPLTPRICAAVLCLFASTQALPTPSALNIAQKPLFLGGTDPNLMFILDASGSMYWSFMPDALGKYALTDPTTNHTGTRATTASYLAACRTSGFAKWMTSNTFNSMYYDPSVTYLPPMNADGTMKAHSSFTAALWNGYITSATPDTASIYTTYLSSTTVNLSSQYRATWGDGAGSSSNYGVQCLYLDNANVQAYYHTFNASNASCPAGTTSSTAITSTAPNDNCFTKVPVSATSGPSRARAELNGAVSTDERTNFANWYTYYRTRMYTAKAGISRAFAQTGTNMYVGYGALNSSTTTIDGISTNTIVRGVRPFKDWASNTDQFPQTSTYRTDFFTWLFAKDPANGTPLREALDYAGKYYESSTAAYAATPWSPDSTKQVSCRQSFTILMTDGYWNNNGASTNAKNDQDGTDGSTISPAAGSGLVDYTYKPSPPFKDGSSNQSGTLADVAMYYWKRDLRTGLTNNVPVSSGAINNAFWQHMTTFTIGMGLSGTIDKTRAFNAIKARNASQTSSNDYNYPSEWPVPAANSENNLDDLLHAGVNGHGGFYSAKDPTEFANALASTLAEVSARAGSASTVAVNSSVLKSGSLAYQASFNSGNWSGDVAAYSINASTGAYTLLAKATDGVPTSAASRKILTWRPAYSSSSSSVAATGVDFTSGNLSSAQSSAISAGITAAQLDSAITPSDIVNYIRGDKSKEISRGGSLRNRSATMGDIVNSDPVYASKLNFGYALSATLSTTARASYTSFVASQVPMVYVGANDGMLHALNGSSTAGDALDEVFAYVPNNVLGNLPFLAKASDFSHRYYVDGPITLGHAYINGAWKVILVGSTGAGGKAYFALDVTTPTSPRVLWEYTNSELGNTLGKAAITLLQNGTWVAIFGNGYNSTSGKASLFVVDLATGTLIRQIGQTDDDGVSSRESANANGLAAPAVVDADADGATDLVFAGDLQGSMWKFDLSATSPSSWTVAFGKKPLFQTPIINEGTTSSPVYRRQPITVKPNVARHPSGGLFVLFGTGKFFETGDQSVTDVQAFYGVRDECGLATGTGCGSGVTTAKLALSNLLQQTFTEETKTVTNATTGASYTETVRNLSKNSDSTKKGWYVNFLKSGSTTKTGERVFTAASLLSDRVVFASSIPNEDVCGYGGESWIWQLDLYSGGKTLYSVFDLNRDKQFGSTDSGNALKYSGGILTGTAVQSAASEAQGGNLGRMNQCDSAGNCTGQWINLQAVTGRQTWRLVR